MFGEKRSNITKTTSKMERTHSRCAPSIEFIDYYKKSIAKQVVDQCRHVGNAHFLVTVDIGTNRAGIRILAIQQIVNQGSRHQAQSRGLGPRAGLPSQRC